MLNGTAYGLSWYLFWGHLKRMYICCCWVWYFYKCWLAVVQLLSCVWFFCDPMCCNMPGLPVLHHFLELAQTHVLWVNDAVQLSHPLLSPSPPALSFSQHQGLFQWVGFSHQVAKVLGLQLQHQCFQWILELISFRIDWFDLLTVRGTLKNFLHYYNLKASILWCSAFIMVHVSHPYVTTGKKHSFGCLDLGRRSIVSAF